MKKRVHAIDAFGRSFQTTQDASASQFVADLVKDSKSSEEVRRAAYWALRQIQLGLTDEEIVRRLVPLAKEVLRKNPAGATEEQFKQTLLCGGRFPENVWNTSEQIDWDFVDRHASRT